MPPRQGNNPKSSNTSSNANRFTDLDPSNSTVLLPTAMDDSSHPFYLHNSENPGTVLVTTPLSASNYHSWSKAMITALDAKNKIGFVDGSIPRPESNDLLFPAWKRCNSMVKSWLINAVSKEIGTSLLCFPTAAEIWVDLRHRFLQSDGPRIFEIKKSLVLLQQGAFDVNTYYTKMKILWDELEGYETIPDCHCGGLRSWLAQQQRDCVMQFLMGLNDSYSQIRGQILLMEPLPSISKVCSLVAQEERQRKIHHDSSFIDSNSVGDASAHSNAVFNRPSRPVCTHCRRVGHTIERCYKIHGFPIGYKTKSGNSARDFSSKGQANLISTTISSGSFDRNLSNKQWHQLVSLLNSQSQHSPTVKQDSPVVASFSSFNGSFSRGDDWDG